jgi:hypothetical protein
MVIVLISYLLMRAFFCLEDCGVCHSALSLLVSGWYQKPLLSSSVKTQVWRSGSVSSRSSISAETSSLIVVQILWNHLCIHFSHVQILCNNSVDRTFIHIKFIGDHSNCQTSNLTNESPHMVELLYLFPQRRGVQFAVHLPPFLACLQSLCATEILEHRYQMLS